MRTLPKIARLLLTGLLLTVLSGCAPSGRTLAEIEYDMAVAEHELARERYNLAQEMRRMLEQASSVEEIDGIMVQAASDRVAMFLTNEGYTALHMLADQRKKVLRSKTAQ